MLYKLFLLYYLYKSDTSFFLLTFLVMLLFTRCATSNASRHFKSPLAMGRDAFKPKHASSVSISEVIDTGVNSNPVSAINSLTINNTIYMPFCQGDSNKSQHTLIKNQQNPTVLFVKTTKTQVSFLYIRKKGSFSPAIHKHTSCNFCK